jgi:hypothetical protein
MRLIADLRIMHGKVDELFELVGTLKRRHTELEIITFEDPPVLDENIERIDEIYLWFVALKQHRGEKAG